MGLFTQQKERSFLPSNNVDANASGEPSVPAAHVSADLISKMDLRGCGEAVGAAFTGTLLKTQRKTNTPTAFHRAKACGDIPFGTLPENVEDLTYLWMIHTRRVPVSA